MIRMGEPKVWEIQKRLKECPTEQLEALYKGKWCPIFNPLFLKRIQYRIRGADGNYIYTK